VASSSKPTSSKNNSPHKSGAEMTKTTFTNGLIAVQTPTTAGSSRPNKRGRDRLSQSSSLSLNEVGGESGSGTRKKRKIEVVELGSRAASASSGRSGARDADVRMGDPEEGAAKPQSRVSSDSPADSASGSRKKRRVNVAESGDGASAPESTSSKREKVTQKHYNFKLHPLIRSRMKHHRLCPTMNLY
jgi:hypothetical protein